MPFQYRDYQNPYVGTIGELMRAGPEARARAAIAIGNAQAQGALSEGAAWSGAIQNLGQIAQGTIGQIVQEREQAPIRAQQAEIRGLQLAGARREASAADRLEATKRQVNSFMNDPDVLNPDGTFNLEGMGKKLAGPLPNGASGPTEPPDMVALSGILEPINARISQARESQRVYAEHQTNALAHLAAGALTLGASTGAYLEYATVGVASVVKAGLMTQPQADQFLARVAENPELALKSAASMGTVAPIKLGEKDRLVSGVDPTHTLVPAVDDPSDKFKGAYTGADDIRRYANGQPITGEVMKPQAPAKAAPAAGSFEDYVTRAAAVAGKTLEQLTPADIEAARKKYQQADDRPRVDVHVGPGGAADVKEAVVGMRDGTIPPQMPGRASKDYTATLAEAHRQGYDLKGAVLDFAATQKHLATLNGAQQTRIRQAVDVASQSLDVIDELSAKWKGGSFPVLNRANLALAKGGTFGADVASVATQLEGQITDVVSELGVVYMGGNSPTDHALGLAEKNLRADWDAKVLDDMVTLARTNLKIRSNSITNVGPVLSSGPAAAATATPATPATSVLPPIPAGMIRAFDPQGKPHLAPVGTPLPPGWTVGR